MLSLLAQLPHFLFPRLDCLYSGPNASSPLKKNRGEIIGFVMNTHTPKNKNHYASLS